MNPLEEVWDWYLRTRFVLRFVDRLGEKHWEKPPDDLPLFRDEKFKEVKSKDLIEGARVGLESLDDLAVIRFFAAFEAIVRGQLRDEVENELKTIKHLVLVDAAQEAIKTIARGSFAWVLDSLKGLDHNLVEQVRQIRRYRNWVSHGRRGNAPPRVGPKETFDRLSAFLRLLDP